MAQGQDIQKVFVAKKDGIVLTAGKKLADLAEGEFAIFDTETNLSVANLNNSNRVYFAILQGGKIVKSPNQWIEKDNVKSISVIDPVDPKNKIATFKNFSIFCGKDYTIRTQAYNELTKFQEGVNASTAFGTATSKNCQVCNTDPCKEINPIPVVAEIYKNLKNNKYVKVTLTARAAITGVTGITRTIAAGDEVFESELKLINTHNEGLTGPTPAYVKLDFKFEAVPLEKDNYQEGYLTPRNTEFEVGLGDNFLGNGVYAVTQQTVTEQGSGFDIRHLEYRSINPDVYSRWSNYGQQVYHTPAYAKEDEKYIQISIRYGRATQVTHLLYDHTQELILAIPSNTTASQVTALKTALKKFEPEVVVGTL